MVRWLVLSALVAFGTACGDDEGAGGSGPGSSGTGGDAGAGGAGGQGGAGGAAPEPGSLDWVVHLKASTGVHGSAPSRDPSGGHLVAGRVHGALDAGPLSSPGDGWDPFVLRIDARGVPASILRGAVVSGGAIPVSVTPPIGLSDGVVIAGSLDGTLTFGTGPAGTIMGDPAVPNGYAVKLGHDGAAVWQLLVSNGLQSAITGLAGDAGGLWFIGSCEGDIDIGTGPLSCGNITRDWLVGRLDATSGEVLRAKTFGGAVNTDIGGDIARLPGGGVVVTGTGFGAVDLGGGTLDYQGDYDVYVGGLDADLNHQWSYAIGGSESDDDGGVAVAGDGTVAVCATVTGDAVVAGQSHAGHGGRDALVVLSQDATPSLVATIGGAGDDGCASVAFAPDGDVVVTGSFQGSVDFGSGPLSATGERDAFHLALSRSGALRYVYVYPAAPATRNNASVAYADARGAVLLGATFEQSITIGGQSFSATGSTDTLIGAVRAVPGP